jgi:palmitoyltransferase
LGFAVKSVWYTVLLPVRVPPYSDGWHFAKRRGLGGKHAGIDLQEHLTDEEFEDDHYQPQPPATSS